jgi:hypothetical protein
MLLSTFIDERSEANIADMCVRPGSSSKVNVVLAKFAEEDAIGFR